MGNGACRGEGQKKKNHYDNRMQRGSAPKEVSSLQLRINSSNLSGSGMCQVTPLESRLGLVWIPPGKGDSGRLLLPPTSHSLSALEWFSSPFFLPARRITSGSLSSKCFVCRPAKLCSQLSSACTRVGSVRAAPKMPPMLLDFSCLKTHQDKLTNSRPGVVWTDWQIGFLGGPVKPATLLHQVVQAD